VGKKHHRDKGDARKINVEIAPGNQVAMEGYVDWYNHRSDRTTPKIRYTDLVNEALDRFLSSSGGKGRTGSRRSAAKPSRGKR